MRLVKSLRICSYIVLVAHFYSRNVCTVFVSLVTDDFVYIIWVIWTDVNVIFGKSNLFPLPGNHAV